MADFLLQTALARPRRLVQLPDMLRRRAGLMAAKKRWIAAYDGCVSTTTEVTTPKNSAVQAQAAPPRQQLRWRVESRHVPHLRDVTSNVFSSFSFAPASSGGETRISRPGGGRVPTGASTGAVRITELSSLREKKCAKHHAKPRFLDAPTVLNPGLKAVPNGPSGGLKDFALDTFFKLDAGVRCAVIRHKGFQGASCCVLLISSHSFS